MRHLFRQFSERTSVLVGSPWAFLLAFAIIILWAITGPLFKFSDTWQLVINTSTTIVTFLMVFLIQNTQNRDSKAIHLKLDELLYGVKGARNSMIDLEHLSDQELEKLEAEFTLLHNQVRTQKVAREKKVKTQPNNDVPENGSTTMQA